uniref:Uncharacterized protein n=1 Tax=Physcomitrium patens TaxID=3218 RepID=A0A2K1JJ25_PHYPA|nr:hypothetical protein PHYPA_018951 [Physcomitrium patens]
MYSGLFDGVFRVFLGFIFKAPQCFESDVEAVDEIRCRDDAVAQFDVARCRHGIFVIEARLSSALVTWIFSGNSVTILGLVCSQPFIYQCCDQVCIDAFPNQGEHCWTIRSFLPFHWQKLAVNLYCSFIVLNMPFTLLSSA